MGCRWYVYWTEKFAKSQKGVPLKARCAGDVHSFLDDIVTAEGAKEWQVEQAKSALVVFYRDLLCLDLKNAPPPEMRESFKDALRDAKEIEKLQIMIRDGKGRKDRVTVQELLGHSDVNTTMICTHVLNRPGINVQSPADMLGNSQE